MRMVATGVVLAALGATCATAQDMDSFRSPSGNIACGYFEGFLRCDIAETSNGLPARPAVCDLDWGKAFEMSADASRAGRICHGDTVLDPFAAVIPYGGGWSQGGFTCLSSERGMSCRNAQGAGWDLSRATQTLY